VLAPGQTILLPPGRTFGAYEFLSVLRASGCRHRLTIGETYSLPYAARLRPGNQVVVAQQKDWIPVATIPAGDVHGVVDALKPLFPGLLPQEHVLYTSLLNLGAMFHPAGTLLNASRIELQGGGFPFYTEGMTPAVCRVIERMDAERRAIAARFGLDLPSAVEMTAKAYGVSGGNLYAVLQANTAYEVGHAPILFTSRYGKENTSAGLLLMILLVDVVVVFVSTLLVIVYLAGSMTDTNLWQTAPNVKRLLL